MFSSTSKSILSETFDFKRIKSVSGGCTTGQEGNQWAPIIVEGFHQSDVLERREDLFAPFEGWLGERNVKSRLL